MKMHVLILLLASIMAEASGEEIDYVKSGRYSFSVEMSWAGCSEVDQELLDRVDRAVLDLSKEMEQGYILNKVSVRDSKSFSVGESVVNGLRTPFEFTHLSLNDVSDEVKSCPTYSRMCEIFGISDNTSGRFLFARWRVMINDEGGDFFPVLIFAEFAKPGVENTDPRMLFCIVSKGSIK